MKYSGVSLPAIPYYDESVYPYACIAESALLPGVHNLYICSEPFYYSADNGRVHVVSGARLCASQHDTGEDAWDPIRNMNSIAGTVSISPLWCNADILDEGGGVYMAGSAPVREPVEIRRYLGCINWLIGFVLALAGKPIPGGNTGIEGS